MTFTDVALIDMAKKVKINVGRCTDINKLHRKLSDKLCFNEYCEKNLDALYEALLNYAKVPLFIEIYGSTLLSDEMQSYVGMIEDFAGELEENGVYLTVVN